MQVMLPAGRRCEALALIDRDLCDGRNCAGQLLFQMFLEPGRMRAVAALDEAFHRSLKKKNSPAD